MRRVVLFATTFLLVSACDFLQPKVSQQKLEDALEQWLIEHDLEAHDIHCPDNQLMENGNTFECTCMVHEVDIPVKVTVTDATNGTVEWEPKYKTLHADEFVAEVKAHDAFSGHSVDITCSDKVLVSIPDSIWDCEIVDRNDGNKAYAAKVTFTDGDGTHNMKWEPK